MEYAYVEFPSLKPKPVMKKQRQICEVMTILKRLEVETPIDVVAPLGKSQGDKARGNVVKKLNEHCRELIMLSDGKLMTYKK